MKMFAKALITLTIAMLEIAAYAPTDAERARWTMFDLRSVATAAAAYKQDHGSYPVASTMDELKALVQPTYVKSLPLHDAWGNGFRYSSDGKTMRIVSAGADGQFKEPTWTTAAKWMSDFGEDAVWADGGFTRNWEYK